MNRLTKRMTGLETSSVNQMGHNYIQVDNLDNALEKLSEYEDAEEKGILMRLPCNVGDAVFVLCECGMIPSRLDGTLYDGDGGPGTATGYYCPYEDNCPHDTEGSDDVFDCNELKQKSAIFEDTVESVTVDKSGIWIRTENCSVYSQLGYAVFITHEEAEAELQKMKLAFKAERKE